jgi:hypothetical protein
MADITEFEYFERYPGSWRMDHPHFKDVAQTTFAKGVITDFQKISDDPIEVLPLVKVDNGEDWLPLFYHPRSGYWSDDQHESLEYNQDQKYYEKAWMSFRCGDEVILMLREGKPYAVLGFADGIPRVGEDKVYFSFDPPPEYDYENFTIGMNRDPSGIRGKIYKHDDTDPKGPDGFPLGLTLECEKSEPELVSSTSYTDWYRDKVWGDNYSVAPGNYPPSPECDDYPGYWWRLWAVCYYKTVHTTEVYTQDIKAKVGPLQFTFKFRIVVTTTTQEAPVFKHVASGEGYPTDPPSIPLEDDPTPYGWEFVGPYTGPMTISHGDFHRFYSSMLFVLPCGDWIPADDLQVAYAWYEGHPTPVSYSTSGYHPEDIWAGVYKPEGTDEVKQTDLSDYLYSRLTGSVDGETIVDIIAKERPHNP